MAVPAAVVHRCVGAICRNLTIANAIGLMLALVFLLMGGASQVPAAARAPHLTSLGAHAGAAGRVRDPQAEHPPLGGVAVLDQPHPVRSARLHGGLPCRAAAHSDALSARLVLG